MSRLSASSSITSTSSTPSSSASRRAPTPEQQRALEVAVGVALSSGAGCGKTTVLTDRFVNALERQQPLSSLAAVTFTEKAAAEMRERIRSECRRRITQGGAEAKRWRILLRGLEAARIGTFHGFCLEILRRFPVQAGLPPGFGVLDNEVAPTLRDEALRVCFQRWLSDQQDDLITLATELGINAVFDGLRSLLDGRALADSTQWANFGPEDLVETWETIWLREERPALLLDFVRKARPCLDLLGSIRCEHSVGEERRIVLINEIPLIVEATDPLMSLEVIQEHAKVQGGGGSRHWPSVDLYGQVKCFYGELRDSAKKTAALLHWDRDETLRSAELGVRFARLAAEATSEFGRIKERLEVVDFDDQLLRARDLLQWPDGPVAKLQGELQLLLIDEFQDTDPVQGAIVQAIAGQGLETVQLFLVGDSKQSIYRFRGARPRIFDEFRSELPTEGRLALTGNFRSVPGILHFVNALFQELYEDPSEALRARPDLESATDVATNPSVEFLWASEPSAPKDSRSKPKVYERRRLEAQWLARLVATRLEQGWDIFDPRLKATRRAGPSDIAFLFRALTSVSAYEQALADEGLDYHTIEGSAFFAQQEVLDVVNLLAAIEDPLDPIALAGSLRSPFFGVSDEGLFWLTNARIDDRPGDLFRNLRQSEQITELSRRDRRRSERARELLDRWRGLKDRIPIALLMNQFLDESGFEAALVADYLGDRKRANVRKLLRLAGQYDRSGLPLADYAARLRTDLRQLTREDQAATNTEQGDAIRIMTIHKAKGLEFPIVVVPDLDRQSWMPSKPVTLHERFGPIVRPEPLIDQSEDRDSPKGLGGRLLQSSESREDRDESIRVFYVATTRAISHLILAAGLETNVDDCKPKSPSLELLSRQFELGTGALRNPLPEGWTTPRVGVITSPPPPLARPNPTRHLRDRFDVGRMILRQRPPEHNSETPRDALRPQARLIDHEVGTSLGPIAARVDGLLRLLLSDPEAGWATDLDAVLQRAAEATIPTSPQRIRKQARELLSDWLQGTLGVRVAQADQRVSGRRWTLLIPSTEDRPEQVHRGWIDLAFREDQDWRLITIAHPDEPIQAAEERLYWSVRGWRSTGLGRLLGAQIARLTKETSPIDESFVEPRKILARNAMMRTGQDRSNRARPAAHPSRGTPRNASGRH